MSMEISAAPEREAIPAHSAEWHNRRRCGIGGSDAAAVLGESKYKTPYDVWLSKTGRSDPTPDNNAMRAGRLLEPVIRKEYADRTGRVVYDPGFLVHDDFPFVVANVDGLCDDRILEIKTARMEWDDIPVEYFFQVQHYMLVTKKERADIFALFGGQEFRIYEVEARPDYWDSMIEIYRAFWDCVTNDEPPELTTLSDVNQAYKNSTEKSIELSAHSITCLDEIKRIKLQIKGLEDQIDKYEVEVKNELADAAVGLNEFGKPAVTWRTGKSKRLLDTAKLKEKLPNVYAEYSKEVSGSRPFLIK